MRRVVQRVFGRVAQNVVQAGHPVLRAHAKPVADDQLGSEALKALTKRMVMVMRKDMGCGLAAPQIGVALQVIVFEVTEDMLVGESRARDLHKLGIELVPLRMLANPRVTPLGTHTTSHREGCLSLPGFSAHVPRHLAVQVDAHDLELNAPVSFRATGWTARIVQHEMDHLQGKLYIDGMDPCTFALDEERVRHAPTAADLQNDGVKVLTRSR